MLISINAVFFDDTAGANKQSDVSGVTSGIWIMTRPITPIEIHKRKSITVPFFCLQYSQSQTLAIMREVKWEIKKEIRK